MSASLTDLPGPTSAGRLLRVSYRSKLTGGNRQYFVHLPAGYDADADRRWPLLLFLHGDGERGDGQDELDRLLRNGPLHEIVEKGRHLPFVVVAPQLPTHETFREREVEAEPELVFPDLDEVALAREPLQIEPSYGEWGLPRGWSHMEDDVLGILDRVVSDLRIDPARLYLTGLSYGGFGTWFFATRHPRRFAAVAPLCGAAPADADLEPLADAGTPLWAFHGGRDSLVLVEWQLKTVQRLMDEGHEAVRFTVHEELPHNVWERVYGGNELYDWLLQQHR